jgi:fumarate reductase flavoprotein subunit
MKGEVLKMKRLLSAVLVLALATVTCMGCSSATTSESTSAATSAETLDATEGTVYVPGIYVGVTESGKGGHLEVNVEFSDNAILSVQVGENSETPSISDAAITQIPEAVVEYQSLAVDTVTGATITSNALLDAIADAVVQAGGDVEALKNVIIEKEQSTDVIDVSADIIIVGAGGAGLSAAMAAADAGINSIVFEKAGSVGGNTIISGGLANLPAVIDALQVARADNTDIYDQYITDFMEGGPQNADEEAVWDKLEEDYTNWRNTDDSKVFDSYEFTAIMYERSMNYNIADWIVSEQRLGSFLEWFLARADVDLGTSIGIAGAPWPNFTPIKNAIAGTGWIKAAQDVIEAGSGNVDFYLNTPATELITDEEGKVTGIIAVSASGETYHATAQKAVILCTGGFSANMDMIREYNATTTILPDTIMTDNCVGDTGDGIHMAEKVGAVTEDMGNVMWLPVGSPIDGGTSHLVGNTSSMFIINKEGVRFADESIDRNSLCNEIFGQTDSMAYLISDAKNSGIVDGYNAYGVSEESLIENGYVIRGESLADLDEQMGLEPGTLEKTVEQFNTAAKTGNDELFGRTLFESGSDLDPENGPYYICPIVPVTHITYGGLVVNEGFQVVDANGNAIEGLYAAGEIVLDECGFSYSMADGYFAVQDILSR